MSPAEGCAPPVPSHELSDRLLCFFFFFFFTREACMLKATHISRSGHVTASGECHSLTLCVSNKSSFLKQEKGGGGSFYPL